MFRVATRKDDAKCYGHGEPVKGYYVNGHLFRFGEVYKIGPHQPEKGTVSEVFGNEQDFFQPIKQKTNG